MSRDRKKTWRHEYVVDANVSDFALRTYLEQFDIRHWLTQVSYEIDIVQACDVGAGYGRLTPVLMEFCRKVTAFEREEHFVVDMQRLLPQVQVQQIEQLSLLPAPSDSFQFVLSFTVLQHLADYELIPVVDELKRIASKPGYILLCEATDASLRYDEDASLEGGVTIGRSVEHYQMLFEPLELMATATRRIEPTYTSHSGTYMLFKRT
jgi:SAM-dependent methyltransferase